MKGFSYLLAIELIQFLESGFVLRHRSGALSANHQRRIRDAVSHWSADPACITVSSCALVVDNRPLARFTAAGRTGRLDFCVAHDGSLVRRIHHALYGEVYCFPNQKCCA